MYTVYVSGAFSPRQLDSEDWNVSESEDHLANIITTTGAVTCNRKCTQLGFTNARRALQTSPSFINKTNLKTLTLYYIIHIAAK